MSLIFLNGQSRMYSDKEPENPDVRVDTTDITPDEAAQEVLLELQRQGYIK